MRMKNWLPEDIKKLRAEHNLTQTSLGRLMGVTRNYIHYLEKGEIEVGTTFNLMLDQIESGLKKEKRRKWIRPFRSVRNFVGRK